jgi:hypothetical protein
MVGGGIVGSGIGEKICGKLQMGERWQFLEWIRGPFDEMGRQTVNEE